MILQSKRSESDYRINKKLPCISENLIIEEVKEETIPEQLTEMSDEEKQELVGVIDDLKEYIPDLSIEIDKETGRLSTQRSELDRLCESYGKLAVAKAKAEAANDNLVAAYKVQEALEYNRRCNTDVAKLLTPYTALQEAILQIASVGMITTAVALYINNAVSLADTLMIVAMSFLVFNQIKAFGMGVSMLRLTSAAIDRTVETEDMPRMDENGKNLNPEKHNIEKNVFFVYRERYIDRGKSVGCRKRWHTAKFRIRESAKKQAKLPKRWALKIRTDSAKIAGRYRNGGKILGACPGAFYVFPLPEFPLPERYFFRYSFGVTPHSFLK